MKPRLLQCPGGCNRGCRGDADHPSSRNSRVCRVFRCSACRRYIPWCNGAADSQGSKCDRCANGPHPLLAAFAALGWRPSNGAVRWLCTMPRDATVERAIKQIHPSWTETLTDLGDALRSCRPVPWSLLALLPSWVAHNTPPVPEKHPADGWKR